MELQKFTRNPSQTYSKHYWWAHIPSRQAPCQGTKSSSGNTNSFVRDSTQFIVEINNIKLDQNDILVIFDVTSLYTNIPIHDAMEVIHKLMDLDT